MENERQGSFNRKKLHKIQRCFRVFIFLMIGILIFLILQAILVPKRFVYTKSHDAGKLAGYYTEEKNSIDVLICGTSHASKAILPMELYENEGIKSYNLSTSSQTVEVAYYMLCEALKTQTPKVFVYDVSALYKNSATKNNWMYALDEMHFGTNKIAFVREYQRSAENCEESMKDMLLPVLRYHIRWKELERQDFTALFSDRHYYGKGGQINSAAAAADFSVDEMNFIEEELLQDTKKTEYVYDGSAECEKEEENTLYSIRIPEKNIVWLEKMKTLCDENGILFLAVKVPAMDLPQSYEAAWTVGKYNATRSLCEECGISYYDLEYDADVDIDWSSDTLDQGRHLNLSGAQKVSAVLGEYLKKQYDLPDEHNEQWDKDLSAYQKVCGIAKLQLEKDFTAYVDMLANECQDKVILIAAADDMTEGLKEDIGKLKLLGLQADFSEAFQKSYIAVIENGTVKYEALSNRRLHYRAGVYGKEEVFYELYSSGWRTSPKASITLADDEFVCNAKEGLNIVVYDGERNLVIDSVCFVFDEEEGYTAFRNNAKTNSLEVAFERHIIEKESR